MGYTNFFHGDLSAKFGVAGSFPFFYGIVAMSLIYHIFVKDSFAVYFINQPTITNEDGDDYNRDT